MVHDVCGVMSSAPVAQKATREVTDLMFLDHICRGGQMLNNDTSGVAWRAAPRAEPRLDARVQRELHGAEHRAAAAAQ